MITLVGVGHVFDISEQVQQIISQHMPAAVAIELDRNRFLGLQARARGEARPAGLNFAARFQERIASQFGVQAGDEMLAAAKGAAHINAKLLLIDMDMNRIMFQIRERLTYEEKVKFFFAMMFAIPFIRKKTVEREMKRFEEGGEEYLDQIAKDFPTIKTVLLDDRNRHMAKAVREIEVKFGTVLAVVGDGHVPGMTKLLEDLDPKVIRLAEVREWKPGVETEGASVSYSFNVQG